MVIGNQIRYCPWRIYMGTFVRMCFPKRVLEYCFWGSMILMEGMRSNDGSTCFFFSERCVGADIWLIQLHPYAGIGCADLGVSESGMSSTCLYSLFSEQGTTNRITITMMESCKNIAVPLLFILSLYTTYSLPI